MIEDALRQGGSKQTLGLSLPGLIKEGEEAETYLRETPSRVESTVTSMTFSTVSFYLT
jgi:hypothetical protein